MASNGLVANPKKRAMILLKSKAGQDEAIEIKKSNIGLCLYMLFNVTHIILTTTLNSKTLFFSFLLCGPFIVGGHLF